MAFGTLAQQWVGWFIASGYCTTNNSYCEPIWHLSVVERAELGKPVARCVWLRDSNLTGVTVALTVSQSNTLLLPAAVCPNWLPQATRSGSKP